MKLKLLSVNSDAKTIKGLKYNYLTAILYLSPHKLSGVNLCALAEKHKCYISCLNTAGRGKFSNVQNARMRKSQWFNTNPITFIDQLKNDISDFIRYATKKNYVPCVRLNGTSDIVWSKHGVIQEFPDTQFYNYYKNPKVGKEDFPNYHLTYSFSGAYPQYPKQHNWAVVFDSVLPNEFHGRKVIDGDLSDLRFLDKKNVVLGLRAKGLAKRDDTGFVVRDIQKFNSNGD